MKIQYCSDLHLEFPENKRFLKESPLSVNGDILLLAGDIVPFKIMDQHNDFFDYVADNFQSTYWLPGNHEYYYYDVADKNGKINERIRENVYLVNNTVVNHDNINLVFSTLWSSISPVNYKSVQQNISDFHVIRFEGQKFNPEFFNQLHKDSLLFLSSALANKQGKVVVISHHVPTFMNYPEKYKASDLNEVFCSELYNLIFDSEASYWIYGYHHYNSADFTINSTR